MVIDTEDSEVVSANLRRALEEANVNYAAKTQEMARTAHLTVYENVDTGEVSYGKLTEDGQVVLFEGAAESAAPPPASAPADASAYYRHARLGVVAAITLALFWLWIRERRSRSAVRR